MILIYDTETTGLPPKGSKDPADPGMPHLVQFAAILTSDEGKELSCVNFIVKPEGWEIPRQASHIHGISNELALKVGVPMRLVAACFTNLRRIAQATAAHNLEFDKLIMEATLHRAGAPAMLGDPERRICTMRESEDLLKLPPTANMVKYGYGAKFKPPNLQELHKFLFGTGFDKAHDALIDVRACLRCLIELRTKHGVCLQSLEAK